MTTDSMSETAPEESSSNSLVEEYKLLVDGEGKYKDQLLEKLESYRSEIKAKLQQGCKQDDYVRYNQFLESIDTAVAVIDKVWTLAREQTQIKGESAMFEEAIGQ